MFNLLSLLCLLNLDIKINKMKNSTVITWDLNDGHCILKKKKLLNGIIKSIQVIIYLFIVNQ